MPVGSGTTFDQVAMETADKVAKESGLVTITEASGIEVDVLDGAPGVSSSDMPARRPPMLRTVRSYCETSMSPGTRAGRPE